MTYKKLFLISKVINEYISSDKTNKKTELPIPTDSIYVPCSQNLCIVLMYPPYQFPRNLYDMHAHTTHRVRKYLNQLKTTLDRKVSVEKDETNRKHQR